MKKFFFLLVYMLISASMSAQGQREVRSLDRSGNSHYKAERYQEAEMDYRRALNINSNDSVARFNLATALINQKDQAKLQEADSILTGLIREGEQTGNRQMMARSLYQKGEIAMMAQQYQQAADAFKESLKLNPTDNEARYNYLVAKKQLDKQQNQDQNQQNQDQQQKQDQKQDQQQNQQQDQQKQDQQQNQQEQPQDQQQQEQQNQQQQMSEDQRQSILEQNEREEKETQSRVMRRQQDKDKEKQREMEIKRMNGTLKDW